jgi:uncharacterized protein YceH (UPF0502 family)
VIVLDVVAAVRVVVVDEDDDAPQPAATSRPRIRAPVNTRVRCICISMYRTRPPSIASRPCLSSMPVHLAELTAPEQRVLGCLIEKRWTTPDQYPLSLNGLRLACNQLTNRDPVTDYDDATVRQAAQRLSLYGLARMASGHGSRALKYRHLAEEALSLDREQLAVLAVLLLRGAQTPGELKARTERMANFASLAGLERALAALSDLGYVRRIPRRPGQKEDRFEQLLGGQADAAPPTDGPAVDHGDEPTLADIVRRLDALEKDLAALRRDLAGLT